MIANPLKTWWSARKIFNRPKISYYFGKWISGLPVYKGNIPYPIGIFSYDLLWKDKYDTPRYEYPPAINIVFFRKYQLLIWLEQDVKYWEQLLWYLYYSDKDIFEAKKSWPWRDLNKISTWSDKYIKT